MLFPTIMAFCSIGVYSVNSNVWDLFVVASSPARLRAAQAALRTAPLLLGIVLGPLLEENLRRAMILSRGDPTTFITRPDQCRPAASRGRRAGRRVPAVRAQEACRSLRRRRLSGPPRPATTTTRARLRHSAAHVCKFERDVNPSFTLISGTAPVSTVAADAKY